MPKTCKACGATSEDQAARCTECGRPFLFGSVAEKTCPSCKKGNPRYREDCAYCGSRL
ncbi:MAG: zinc ribbon domain-containing protein [Methanomassiliicoccales archaeon]|nr:zinc ribbon domain-containing protein [Methanomassiliicoccales archaeon]MDD1756420.1 zinc ribbon domain-containing protein [Methanomassiliicoccales archaeon]